MDMERAGNPAKIDLNAICGRFGVDALRRLLGIGPLRAISA